MAFQRTRESEEMYLETILRLYDKRPAVRAVDISEELGFAKSSVSRAVGLLKKRGFVSVDRGSGQIVFTEAGKAKAEAVFERHRILTDLFIKMGAGRSCAEENACRIEHVVSEELMRIFKEFLKR